MYEQSIISDMPDYLKFALLYYHIYFYIYVYICNDKVMTSQNDRRTVSIHPRTLLQPYKITKFIENNISIRIIC